MNNLPEVIVQPTRIVVSCLPEGHDDRSTYTVQIEYRGDGLWSVKRRGQFVAADGTTSPGFAWSLGPDEPATEDDMAAFDEEQAVWLAAHRFDYDTALRLAVEQAPTLTYRGRSVADVLAEPPAAAPV
jgi:hypothetical protein